MTAMPDRAMLEEQIVHLDLGADVDAAGRLVDDQHLGPERQPARQHDLLLVAAGKVDDELLRARHADVERACGIPRPARSPSPRRRRRPSVRDRSSDGHRQVHADGERQEQRLLLAVLGHEADAVADRLLRRADVDRLAVDRGCGRNRTGRRRRSRAPSRCGRRRPARRCRGSRRARTDSDTSSSTVALRIAASCRGADSPSTASATSPAVVSVAAAEERVDLAADHHADDAVDVGLGDLAAADERPSRSTV